MNKKDTDGLPVRVSPRIWAELMYLTRGASPDEVSGVGEVEIIDGSLLTVTKIHIVKQVVSASATDFDTASFAQLIGSHPHPENLKLWWHTHGTGGAFWSPKDIATIIRLRGVADWVLSLVLNTRGEYLARLDIVNPVPLPSVKLILQVEEKLSKEDKQYWKKELKEKVSRIADIPSSVPSTFGQSHPLLDSCLPDEVSLSDEWEGEFCSTCHNVDGEVTACVLGYKTPVNIETPACSSWHSFATGIAKLDGLKLEPKFTEVNRLTKQLQSMRLGKEKEGKE